MHYPCLIYALSMPYLCFYWVADFRLTRPKITIPILKILLALAIQLYFLIREQLYSLLFLEEKPPYRLWRT